MKNESPRCKQHQKHSCERDRNNDGDRQLMRRRGRRARAKTKDVLLTHHSLLMKTDGDFQISTNRMIKSEAIVATVIITVIHERHRHL